MKQFGFVFPERSLRRKHLIQARRVEKKEHDLFEVNNLAKPMIFGRIYLLMARASVSAFVPNLDQSAVFVRSIW